MISRTVPKWVGEPCAEGPRPKGPGMFQMSDAKWNDNALRSNAIDAMENITHAETPPAAPGTSVRLSLFWRGTAEALLWPYRWLKNQSIPTMG
jgi:hypothetical protein